MHDCHFMESLAFNTVGEIKLSPDDFNYGFAAAAI